MEINHAEAKELAEYKQGNSNLARCYLDLTRQLAEARAERERMRTALCEIDQLVGYGVRHDLGDAVRIAQAALSPPREDKHTAAMGTEK